jgi:fructose-1,6-bisphosphatase/sedoheptulose 1,7-bisphosphatase-like protein
MNDDRTNVLLFPNREHSVKVHSIDESVAVPAISDEQVSGVIHTVWPEAKVPYLLHTAGAAVAVTFLLLLAVTALGGMVRATLWVWSF